MSCKVKVNNEPLLSKLSFSEFTSDSIDTNSTDSNSSDSNSSDSLSSNFLFSASLQLEIDSLLLSSSSSVSLMIAFSLY